MSSLPDIELVFVSGILDSEIWKHQKKYFDRCSRVETTGGENYRDLRKDVLDGLDSCDNAVVVGAEMGNYVVQSVEDHDSVVSTVLTGPFDRPPFVGEKSYRYGRRILKHPKLARKFLFSESEYRIVKEFLHLSDFPDFETYRSFIGKSLRVPVKNSLTIYNQKCNFSTMGAVEDLRPNSETALLDAGSFSFFEKPQEYNKALNDYLLGRKDILERRRLVKSASENRSLKDFEDKIRLERK